MCVYIYIYIDTFVYVLTYVSCICSYACMSAFLYVWIQNITRTSCIYVYVYACVYINLCINIHIHSLGTVILNGVSGEAGWLPGIASPFGGDLRFRAGVKCRVVGFHGFGFWLESRFSLLQGVGLEAWHFLSSLSPKP